MAFIETKEKVNTFERDIVCCLDSKYVIKPEEKFYSDAANYWSEVPPTVDGMLGGFGHISETDIQGSRTLLRYLFHSKHPPGKQRALDCGAGIGRISKYLLTKEFETVDLVEQNPVFLEQAKSYIGSKNAQKVGKYFPVGLQSFVPEDSTYDVIWIQWVLGHLTDSHLIDFFKRCKNGLKENGVIVVKENMASCDVEVDKNDSSVTRPYSLYMEIFVKAGLQCYKKIRQPHFPRALYTVYMFALKPIKDVKPEDTEMEMNEPNTVVSSGLKN